MNCEMCQEMLSEYALGQCEAAVAADVAEHVAQCGACQRELAAVEATWSALPLALSPLDSPADMRQRVLGRIYAEAPRNADAAQSVAELAPTANGDLSDRQRMWSLVLAASVLLGLGLYALGTARSNRGDADQIAAEHDQAARRLAARLSALQQGTQAAPASRFELQPAGANDAGEIRVAWDQGAGQWHVFAVDVPPPPPGMAYMFWFVGTDGQYAGAPLVTQPGAGAQAVVDLPEHAEQFEQAIVTLETDPAPAKPAGQPLWRTANPVR